MAALAKDAYARAALVTMACALAAAGGADTGAFAVFSMLFMLNPFEILYKVHHEHYHYELYRISYI